MDWHITKERKQDLFPCKPETQLDEPLPFYIIDTNHDIGVNGKGSSRSTCFHSCLQQGSLLCLFQFSRVLLLSMGGGGGGGGFSLSVYCISAEEHYKPNVSFNVSRALKNFLLKLDVMLLLLTVPTYEGSATIPFRRSSQYINWPLWFYTRTNLAAQHEVA